MNKAVNENRCQQNLLVLIQTPYLCLKFAYYVQTSTLSPCHFLLDPCNQDRILFFTRIFYGNTSNSAPKIMVD